MMALSLEIACERILGKRVAQAIIEDQGLRWAIVAAMAAAQNLDDREAIAELRRYPHAMHQAELDRHEQTRHDRRRAEEAQAEEDHAAYAEMGDEE